MKRIRRKIVLACSAVLMLLLTTVTTTFAWFSLNESAWLEGMTLEIENMDNLLITSDYDTDTANMKFKQYLTAEDIVQAINKKRELDGKNPIGSLAEIELSPVTTTDGVNFKETVTIYDDMNRQTLDFKEADPNKYISFRISFTVENNGEDRPDFKLFFATKGNDEGKLDGVRATKFVAQDQAITLINNLVNGDKAMKPQETLMVNPVNALRMAVTDVTNTVDNKVHIYNIGKASEVKGDEVQAANLGDLADAENAEKNAMFTYYNNVNNAKLPVMEKISDDVVQHDNFDEALAVFAPATDSSYKIVTLDIVIWMEGYDADSIIGVDSSILTMLLTFKKDPAQHGAIQDK